MENTQNGILSKRTERNPALKLNQENLCVAQRSCGILSVAGIHSIVSEVFFDPSSSSFLLPVCVNFTFKCPNPLYSI